MSPANGTQTGAAGITSSTLSEQRGNRQLSKQVLFNAVLSKIENEPISNEIRLNLTVCQLSPLT